MPAERDAGRRDGAPGFRGDVLIERGGILAVGDVGRTDATEVDLGGLVLAPGFVDPHTHYDAELTWDEDLAPSCWHGVTTVVSGNCGYTVAPVRPDAHDTLIGTLEVVEGMSAEALAAGIRWNFESFPEYIDALAAERRRLNVATLVGHTAVRFYVMGQDAAERHATADEVEQMAAIVRGAVEAGAFGFSTLRNGAVGAEGRPVPSRVVDPEEVLALARALGATGRGTIQVLPSKVGALDEVLAEVGELARASGRPVTFASVMSGLWGPRGCGMEVLERAAASDDGWLVPQIACRPVVQQVSLKDPFLLARMSDAFEEVYAEAPEAREGLYRDTAWRARAAAGLRRGERIVGAKVLESRRRPEWCGGPTLGELAARQGTTPLDVLLDLSLEEGLETRFEIALANDDEDEVGDYLADNRGSVALGDAGAHQSQICDAVYPTYLLGHWVRERAALSLEHAVWHLTAHPARVFGLHDRGRIALGLAADLVAFDPDTVAPGPLQRVWDLPGGADRLLAPAVGVPFVWVGGTPIRFEDEPVDAYPGAVLRSVASNRRGTDPTKERSMTNTAGCPGGDLHPHRGVSR